MPDDAERILKKLREADNLAAINAIATEHRADMQALDEAQSPRVHHVRNLAAVRRAEIKNRPQMTSQERRIETALMKWGSIIRDLDEFDRNIALGIASRLKKGKPLSDKQAAQVLRIWDDWRDDSDGEVMDSE